MDGSHTHNIFLLLLLRLLFPFLLLGSPQAVRAKSTKSVKHVAKPRPLHGSVSDGCKVSFGAVLTYFFGSISIVVCLPAAQICATPVTFSQRRLNCYLELAFSRRPANGSRQTFCTSPQHLANLLLWFSIHLKYKAKLASGDFMSFGNSRERERVKKDKTGLSNVKRDSTCFILGWQRKTMAGEKRI